MSRPHVGASAFKISGSAGEGRAKGRQRFVSLSIDRPALAVVSCISELLQGVGGDPGGAFPIHCEAVSSRYDHRLFLHVTGISERACILKNATYF